MGDQHGFFRNIKSVQLEETKKVESPCVRDEGGRLLRDKERIRERWVRFFRSLLDSKSGMLDPDIPKRLPQQPVASALGIEPTEEEIATAMKAMANEKAVGLDGLPAKLLKLGLQQDRTILLEFHRLTTLVWREGKVPQQWKDAVITVLHFFFFFTIPSRARSLRNLLVSGNECGRVFPAGVGPGSPSRDAANWLPSRFSLSVETRRRYSWLRMTVFPGARLFPSPNLVPFGRVAARERQGALSRRAW